MKRPLVAAAVCLAVCIAAGRALGVLRRASPPAFFGQPQKVSVTGRVTEKQTAPGGLSIILRHYSILTSNLTDPVRDPDLPNSDDSGEYGICVQDLLLNGNECGPGDLVTVEGTCTIPRKATNPGQFDPASYYAGKKILLLMEDARLTERGKAGGLWRLYGVLPAVREKMSGVISGILEPEDAGTLQAVLLGDRNNLDPGIKQAYQYGGIAHILAISSLHIWFAARGIYRFLRRRRLPLWVCCLFECLAGVLYCLLTGCSISAVRAVLLLFIDAGGKLSGRTPDAASGTAAAAIVLLLQDPLVLWESSFLLSFTCVFSLAYLAPALRTGLQSLTDRRQTKSPGPQKAPEGPAGRLFTSLCGSAAIMAGTLPVTLWFFYQFSPYSILANLLVIPCMSVVLMTGAAGTAAGLFLIPAGIFLVSPCHYLLKLFTLTAGLEQQLPWGVLVTGRPAWWKIPLYYALIGAACFFMRPGRHVRAKVLTGTAVLLLSVIFLAHRNPPAFRMTVLDVGQGDGILLEAGKISYMIDGGSSTSEHLWSSRLERALRYYGIRRLDAVILTHGDLDHCSGVLEWMEGYRRNLAGKGRDGLTLDRILVSEAWEEDEGLKKVQQAAGAAGVPCRVLPCGTVLSSPGLTLTCLQPEKEKTTGDPNQDSLVLLAESPKVRYLLTGDLELEGEQRLVRTWKECGLGTVDVLKVGHHGSRNATSEELLELIRPTCAVISCGRNNIYGHPAQETLQRLTEAGSRIWRTDREGAFTAEE